MWCMVLVFLWWMLGCLPWLYYKVETEGRANADDIGFSVLTGFFGPLVGVPVLFLFLLKWWQEVKDD